MVDVEIRGRLARRLIVAIIIASSAVALLTTSAQLYLEYDRDLRTIEGRFGEIENSYLASVVENVWLADRNRLQLVLNGISRLPDFKYAAAEGDGLTLAAGERGPGDLTRSYPLVVQWRGTEQRIGTLTVAAGTEGVLRRLIERVWIVLASNALKTALVAMLMFAIVERIVARRVVALADDARRIGRGDLETPLALDGAARDELGDLACTFDEMRRRLLKSDAELRHSLLERTAALEQSRQAQRELNLAASVFASTLEGIVITDPDGVIQSVNDAFTVVTGWSRGEAVGKHTRMLKSKYQGPEFYEAMWRQLGETGRWQGELWNRRKDGEAFLVWETITTIFDDEGRPERRIAIFSDITELRRQEERIHYQTNYDALSGLPNRALFRDRLEQALMYRQAGHDGLAVLILDIDRFKLVNDSLGHEVGDELLKQVAQRLRLALESDGPVIARLGGDEFGVLQMRAADGASAAHMAETLIASLREPFVVDEHQLHMGACIGISIAPDDGADASTLIKKADAAMYKAKEAGGNAFRFFDAGMDAAALLRLETEASLRRAIEAGEFELHYQPKIRIASGALSGVEALIRWRDPAAGLIAPMQFIPLAEETGLIEPIGAWAMRAACRQMAAWDAAGLEVPSVAVNVSARQFASTGLADIVHDAVAEAGLRSSRLEIELTESVLMKRPEQAARLLRELSAAGITIAIDDFGTGYSSLSYLKQLPIGTLKIDRSFIREIGSDQRDQVIAEAVIAMAGSLGFEVVAEGVETREQLDFLASRGCHHVQGYLFARPMPPDELARWLAARQVAAEVE